MNALGSNRIVKATRWRMWAAAALLLVGFLNVGFARTPLAHWTGGEVLSIDLAKSTFVLREPSGKKPAFSWDKATRFWVEPTKRRDRGVVFDPAMIKVGEDVRVLGKKRGAKNIATRVIQLSTK